jgi:hypothetical protein
VVRKLVSLFSGPSGTAHDSVIRLAWSWPAGKEMLQAVKVPVTIGVIHLLQAILDAEAVSPVGLDEDVVLGITLSGATPDQPEPNCLDCLLRDSYMGCEQHVKVPWDA